MSDGAPHLHVSSFLMTEDREFLKRAITSLLDAIAAEHEERHQPSKAARYVLLSRHCARVEVMFEKNADSPSNIWCLEAAAGKTLIAELVPRPSPASTLWTKRGKDGEALYGRHSALERMGQLGGADLVCFAPKCMAEVGRIIDRLRDVAPSDLS